MITCSSETWIPPQHELGVRDELGGIGLEARTPDHHDGVLQEDGRAQGGHHHREPACPVHGAVGQALHHHTDERYADGGRDDRHEDRPPEAEVDGEEGSSEDEHGVPQVRTEGEEVAVGEVDQLQHPVHHGVAQGDQGVERADGQPVDDLFQDNLHASSCCLLA